MKNKLMRLAKQAAENAYAPYSDIHVGAALLSEDGRIFTGCNVENASYSVTCCAERVALFTAVSQGARSFSAIAVTHSPCGTCRQALSEFGDMNVILPDKTCRLSALLPDAFVLDDSKLNS